MKTLVQRSSSSSSGASSARCFFVTFSSFSAKSTVLRHFTSLAHFTIGRGGQRRGWNLFSRRQQQQCFFSTSKNANDDEKLEMMKNVLQKLKSDPKIKPPKDAEEKVDRQA